MFAPYGRLRDPPRHDHHRRVLAIAFTGAPAAAIVVLVLLKTALDLGFHLREHRGLGGPVASVAIE